MLAVPQIPGYELVLLLGGGSYSCVYSARNCPDGVLCALKTLRPECDDQTTARKLLQREARAGLTVRHRHLVRYYDAHVLKPPHFLAMELLRGESVKDRLRHAQKFELATAVLIARQVSEALAALHRAGFVHGDLKPENIHLGENGTAKLIDLGFAHRPGENAGFLRDGFLMGTANYLAPELCAFDPAADERSDLFSLGVTLFEMLTGRLPYPTGSTYRTLQRHLNERPADVGSLVGGLPHSLVSLVDCLLDHQPSERPSARAAVQQLAALEPASRQIRRSA
jgi:serine/threonine protein kinase